MSQQEELRDACVLAPLEVKALESLLSGDLPELPTACAVVWLDDLERFMTPTRRGMSRRAFGALARRGGR